MPMQKKPVNWLPSTHFNFLLSWYIQPLISFQGSIHNQWHKQKKERPIKNKYGENLDSNPLISSFLNPSPQ